MKTKRLLLVLLSIVMMSMAGISSAATEENRSLGGFNSVIIYTPTSMSPLGGRSLMIVLHGCTQPNTAFRTANLQAAADQHGMVIAVPDAVHKAGFACWDYWTGVPNRNMKDYKNLISLANTMAGDSKYEIDRDQIYIAGLSSGGSFAMNTACLAPDVFAGMGLVGTPSAGTSSSGAITVLEGSPQSTQRKCESFAGANKPHFQTQVTVSAFGTGDHTVNKGYGPQNATAMALIYGHSDVLNSADIPKAKIKVNAEKSVALVELAGEGHAWPGGPGSSGSYIGSASINYANYLGEFFNANNRRVKNDLECTVPGPIPSQPSGLRADEVTDKLAEFSVAAESSYIVKYRVSELNTGKVLGEPSARVTDGRATFKITGLTADTHYQVQVVAIDNCGQESEASAPISFTTREVIIVYNSSNGTATDHYVAGRLNVTEYVAFGGKYGYVDSFTLWEVNGKWTDVDPNPAPNPNPNPNPDPDPVPENYTVSTVVGAGGKISPTSLQVAAGNIATFTVTANAGYLIDSVSGCNGTLSGNTYKTAAVTANCAVNAQFKAIPEPDPDPVPVEYTVNAKVGTGNGTVSPATQNVVEGKTAKITFNPASGYEYDSYSGCGATLSGKTLTIANVNSSCEVTVNFKEKQTTKPPSIWDIFKGWWGW